MTFVSGFILSTITIKRDNNNLEEDSIIIQIIIISLWNGYEYQILKNNRKVKVL